MEWEKPGIECLDKEGETDETREAHGDCTSGPVDVNFCVTGSGAEGFCLPGGSHG